MSTPLSTTDPAELANLARCWSSCVPIGLQMPMRTMQISNIAVIATNPTCVTPNAPTNLRGATTDTTIKLAWAQPSTPGTFVFSWQVFWGTTMGGPYPNNSPVIFGRNYTITGLAAGTQYFVVVKAIGTPPSCQSANSAESNFTTSGTPSTCGAGTTFASAWAARVVANGGVAPSAATQTAIANFQCGLISDGLDTSMLSWNTFASDNLIAAITPQLLSAAVGSFDPWTNHNFVLADLNASGLIGNGANKFLATGMNQQDPAFWGPNVANNCGITAYVENNPNGAQAVITGNSDGGASLFALEMFGGNTEIILWDVASDIVAANAGFTGYVSCNRTAINSLAIYESNSGIPHHTLATSAVNNGGSVTTNAFPIVVFCFSDNTGTSLFEYKRLGFIAFHKGLSSAQSALFSARVQTLMSALGRAI